jgi:hypothetical protein
MQTFIPLSFNASRSQSASYPRSPKSQSAFGRLLSSAGVVAHLSGRHEKPDRAALRFSDGM